MIISTKGLTNPQAGDIIVPSSNVQDFEMATAVIIDRRARAKKFAKLTGGTKILFENWTDARLKGEVLGLSPDSRMYEVDCGESAPIFITPGQVFHATGIE